MEDKIVNSVSDYSIKTGLNFPSNNKIVEEYTFNDNIIGIN